MSDDSHCLIHSCLIEENSEVVEPCLSVLATSALSSGGLV